MRHLTFGQTATMLALGLLGWALCGAIMFVGMAVTSLQTTPVIHAISAPIIFAAISWLYFTKLGYSSPLATAVVFLCIVMATDFFLVALAINRSLKMFQDPLGTWIPFAFIFLSTYVTGTARDRAMRFRTGQAAQGKETHGGKHPAGG